MNKNGTFKKTIPFVIAMAIALTLLSGLAMTAYAAAPDISVSDEFELEYAVSLSPDDSGPYMIELENDISLTSVFYIPAEKNIVLVSGAGGPFALIGIDGFETIFVDGILTLGTADFDGIIVTHEEGEFGRGVFVSAGGALIMNSGEISGNTVDDWQSGGGVFVLFGTFNMAGGVISNNEADQSGGGVYVAIASDFTMTGGEITNNKAINVDGGGVSADDIFKMTGGKISNNTANYFGGGVSAVSFEMSGGKISDNAVNSCGGGVSAVSFEMSGGEIVNNTAESFGGGVYISHDGCFVMEGGEVIGNTARNGGGIYSASHLTIKGGKVSGNNAGSLGGGIYSSFVIVLEDGEVSDNTAISRGGGVYSSRNFDMSGGEIVNNTAIYGGGVYISRPSDMTYFNLTGGKISDNTAFGDGGGVWITDTNENLDIFTIPANAAGVVFSNNSASESYDRSPADDSAYAMYIAGAVTWSKPFTQGYNNYDISYKWTGSAAGDKDSGSGFGLAVITQSNENEQNENNKNENNENENNKNENNKNELNNSGSSKAPAPPAKETNGGDSKDVQDTSTGGMGGIRGALFWVMVLLTAPAIAAGFIYYKNKGKV
ncbi:MAG: hypothetical protein FWE54_04330 [Methanimicrococcus sp.]|nr:hypothetical protein [Methanimicrococcus sp.]